MKTGEGGTWEGAKEVMQGLMDCEMHSGPYFKGNLMPLKDIMQKSEVIIFVC